MSQLTDLMWARHVVRMDFVTKLCASVPGESEMVKKWLESRQPRVRPAQSRSLDEIQVEVLETIAAGKSEGPGGEDDDAEFVPLIFQRLNGALMVRLATIVRGHLKDCAYQVQTYLAGAVEGEKSFSVRFKNAMYFPPVDPLITMFRGTPFVPILREDGTPVTEPDGIHEKPVHFVTRQGPRSALKAFEFVLDARIDYPLYVLRQPPRVVRQKEKGPDGKVRYVPVPQAGKLVVSEEDIKQVLLYGGVHGYGGERSDDGGRYAFIIATPEEG